MLMKVVYEHMIHLESEDPLTIVLTGELAYHEINLDDLTY